MTKESPSRRFETMSDTHGYRDMQPEILPRRVRS